MNREEFLLFADSVNSTVPIMLKSAPGKGKTSICEQLTIQRKRKLFVVPLAEYEPGDIMGMPYVVEHKGHRTTTFAAPWWWPVDDKTDVLLDEVDRCREEMHSLAMQMLSRRQIGPHKLPEETRILLTGNGPGFLGTIPIGQALVRRLAMIEYSPTVSEWLEWAASAGIHNSVLEYIKQHPLALDTPEKLLGRPNDPVPCRSTWERVGVFLQRNANNTAIWKKVHLFTSPFIGMEAAEEFRDWILADSRLGIEDIFESKIKASDIDLFKIAEASGKVAKEIKHRSPREQYNALHFFKDAGREPFAALVSAMDVDDYKVLSRFKDIQKLADSIVGDIE